MAEKRVNVVVLLFLFIAAGLGMLAALVDFSYAFQHLHEAGKPGKGAILTLTDGIINLGFALFLLAFSAAYKTKETPESIIDVLSFALFMRLLFAGYLIFHLLPLETMSPGKLQLHFVPIAGVVCSLAQALFLAFGVGLMGADDMGQEGDERGRDGVISVDAYLSGKSPSAIAAEHAAQDSDKANDASKEDDKPDSSDADEPKDTKEADETQDTDAAKGTDDKDAEASEESKDAKDKKGDKDTKKKK